MYNVTAYQAHPDVATIKQLSPKREWMDATWEKHAYHCFPLTLANGLGWGISFPEDISFIWDGITDPSPDHIKITQGERYCSTVRGNASISFHTGIIFKTDPDVTLLQIPIPNMFDKRLQPFTNLLSTSFYHSIFPVVLRVLEPNVEITIKAGEPIISILPISLNQLQDSVVTFENIEEFEDYKDVDKRTEKMMEASKEGRWSNFYRNAIDHNGDSVGSHEVKSINLKVDETNKGKGLNICNL